MSGWRFKHEPTNLLDFSRPGTHAVIENIQLHTVEIYAQTRPMLNG
jgi:hypothetical protein